MTAIIIPRKHYKQPSGRLVLDQRWCDLVRSFVAPGLSDTYGALAPTSAVPISTSSFGVVGSYTGVAGQTLVGDWIESPPLTVLAWVRPTGDNIIPWASSNSAVLDKYYCVSVSSGVVRAVHRNTTYDYSASSTTVTLGEWSMVGASFETEWSRRAIHNGVLASANTRYQTYISATSKATTVGSLHRSTGVTDPWQGDIGLVVTCSLLDADVIAELYRNPWQLFRADPVRIYSLPSGPIIPVFSAASFAGRVPSVTVTY